MGQTGHLFLSKAYFATLRCEYFSTVNYWLDEYHYSFIANILRIIGSIPFSSGQKWFLRPYFPLIRGMFLLRSGLRFLFRALEMPELRVRKRPFLVSEKRRRRLAKTSVWRIWLWWRIRHQYVTMMRKGWRLNWSRLFVTQADSRNARRHEPPFCLVITGLLVALT